MTAAAVIHPFLALFGVIFGNEYSYDPQGQSETLFFFTKDHFVIISEESV
jgi:hypothetical protein